MVNRVLRRAGPRCQAVLKPGGRAADVGVVLTRALLSALLLAIPLVASWVLVRRTGHPAQDRL